MNVSCLSSISWYQSNNESRVVSAFSRHVHVNKADCFLKSERTKWFRVLKALIGAGKSMKGCLWLPGCGFSCKNGFIFSRFPALYPAAVKCQFCCCHLFSVMKRRKAVTSTAKRRLHPLFTEQREIDLNVVICYNVVINKNKKNPTN